MRKTVPKTGHQKRRRKPTAADIIAALSGSLEILPERVDGPASDLERANVAVRVAEKVAAGQICWCMARHQIEGAPPCPMHGDK